MCRLRAFGLTNRAPPSECFAPAPPQASRGIFLLVDGNGTPMAGETAAVWVWRLWSTGPTAAQNPIRGHRLLSLLRGVDGWLHGADRAHDQNDQEAQCLLTENVTMKLGKPGSRSAQLIVSDQ